MQELDDEFEPAVAAAADDDGATRTTTRGAPRTSTSRSGEAARRPSVCDSPRRTTRSGTTPKDARAIAASR